MFLCSLMLKLSAQSQFFDFDCDEDPEGKAAGRGDRSSLRTLSIPPSLTGGSPCRRASPNRAVKLDHRSASDRSFQDGSAQERLILAVDTESGVAHKQQGSLTKPIR
jgi:hypothetical protein